MFFVLLACSLPAEPDTFVPVDDALGPAWAWDADPTLVVTVADGSEPYWAPGLYLRHGDDVAAHFAVTDLLSDAAWMPPVLAVPGDPLRLDEPGLALNLVGDDARACADALVARVTPLTEGDDLVVDVALEGVPTLALPTEGAARVGDYFFDLADVGADGLTFLEVDGLVTPDLTVTFPEPVPRLDLEARDGFVEVDLGGACAAPAWTTDAVLSLTL